MSALKCVFAEVKHMFTIQEPNWGITRFLRLTDAGNPLPGYIMNDALDITVNVRIMNKAIVSPFQDTSMEWDDSEHSCPETQPLVSLDVGGQSFKIAKSTLARYPHSLLSKMVREFPSLIEKGEELFIDRNPKAFPWIQEIYRSAIHTDNS